MAVPAVRGVFLDLENLEAAVQVFGSRDCLEVVGVGAPLVAAEVIYMVIARITMEEKKGGSAVRSVYSSDDISTITV